ncbi:MAG TPA: ubiquitin-like domain-containing protein [Actinomycetota bacterium]|nr:ubiquitin-like domain-containing protein [Actinomycetota bacterium]
MRVRATRVRRLRIRRAMGNAALAVAVFTVGTLYLALEKNVTLVVNGRPQAVRTLSTNVGELLDTRGIVLDGGDVVEPPPATPLADGMTVVVDTGGSAAPVVQTQGVGVWVMEGADGPSAKLAVQPAEDSFSAGVGVGPSRIVYARVVVMGKEHDVFTNAGTVGELLSAMGVTPDPDDRVHPSPSAPIHAGSTVRYVRVDFGMQRVIAPIPYQTLTSYTSDLPPGVVRILRRGESGSMLELFRVKRVDGVVVARTLLTREVLRPAIDERREIGKADTAPGTEVGQASWYYAPGSGMTAAHPWLPYGTVVTVTNLANGKSVKVVINDRGPFGGRIIDLSPEAFSALAPLGAGVIQVRLTW